jgi:hypothetical protein
MSQTLSSGLKKRLHLTA